MSRYASQFHDAVDQAPGGMSAGGNRHTQIPSMKLYLDPNKAVQGRGFWTGKYAPSGKASQYKEDAADMAKLTAFQEKGAPHEVVRHYDGTPEDEEETIKSIAKKVTSVQLFGLAKKAMEQGDIPAYVVFKGELENRAFMNKVRKALHAMGTRVPTDAGAGRSAAAGRGKDSIPANRDKRVFNATHGTDDETSTSDKDELSIEPAVDKKSLVRDMRKAILTKPSEKREKPQKKSKPAPKAKVGASKNGNKTYNYRQKVNPPGQKKSPAESPPSSSTPTGTPGDAATLEAKPERLANILGIDVSRLQKLAEGRSEHEFISYFKAKGSTFLSKHKVPDEYLSQVYYVLSKNTVKSVKPKSLNPKTPVAKLKKRGVTLVKQFKVNPTKLKKGSEERVFAEQMVVSRVNTLPKLATFLAKGYDLLPTQAAEMAQELHASLEKEGALS